MNCKQLLQETRIASSVLLWQHCCRRSKSETAVKLHRLHDYSSSPTHKLCSKSRTPGLLLAECACL